MVLQKSALDIQKITSEFFEDTKLLGIVTTVKDYRFCWHLNIMLGMDFRVNHEIEIQLNRKKRIYFFSVYEYKEPVSTLVHYLYNNLWDGEYLLPEFKHLDFLWLMKNDTVTDDYLNHLVLLLKSIPDVQLVTELNSKRIKNKEYLIF